jgi:hypothetical protein
MSMWLLVFTMLSGKTVGVDTYPSELLCMRQAIILTKHPEMGVFTVDGEYTCERLYKTGGR